MNYAINTLKQKARQHIVVSEWTEQGSISMRSNGKWFSGVATPCERLDVVKRFGAKAITRRFIYFFYTIGPVVIDGYSCIFIECDDERYAIPKRGYPIAVCVGNNRSFDMSCKHWQIGNWRA